MCKVHNLAELDPLAALEELDRNARSIEALRMYVLNNMIQEPNLKSIGSPFVNHSQEIKPIKQDPERMLELARAIRGASQIILGWSQFFLQHNEYLSSPQATKGLEAIACQVPIMIQMVEEYLESPVDEPKQLNDFARHRLQTELGANGFHLAEVIYGDFGVDAESAVKIAKAANSIYMEQSLSA